jgi:aminoglycoside phosphotransferase (APT) family kinase protein
VEAEQFWRLRGLAEYGELAAVRTLSGGASGSAVYQLKTSRGDEFVLKVNRKREQADRELTFYRDLAGLVPVRVPTLIAEADNCLLLESAGTAADATQFSSGDWETLAAELGRLHRLPPVAAPLGFPRSPSSAGATMSSAQIWAELGHDLTDIWPDLPRMDAALAALPTCLRHGDFHLGNLLVNPAGDFVWIDWQETGPGNGPEELAFLCQRAEADGLTPPRDAMLTTYASARGIPNNALLRRAFVAAELQLLLLAWPEYLGFRDNAARTRLSTRLSSLLTTWKANKLLR